MNENYFMGLDGFVWFTGVVENRNDPAKLGRVQVRCLGYHTEDLIDIPTADLPWAHIMMPVTDPSMQGLGTSPSFLTEGSWVIGFFRDAIEKQQPVIMGSLPGVPQSEADITKGFNDPGGDYPSEEIMHSGHGLNESDVSRLARGVDAETHKSVINRRDTVWKGIPTATKPNVSSVSTTSKTETAGSFDEPIPRGYEPGTQLTDVEKLLGTSKTVKKAVGNLTGIYPFNHVYESEAGHIKEVDDTPDGERLYTQHAAGTYEEIIANGTKTVKVVGDNYELIAGKSNIYVRGDINLTCSGTKREKIDGDYILEVGGDFTRKIHKSEQVKIGAGDAGGNLEEEIIGNHGFNISNSVSGAIGSTESGTAKDCDITIGGKETRTIGGTYDITTADSYTLTSSKDIGLLSFNNITAFSVASTSISSGTTLTLKSAEAMSIKSDTAVALESISTMDIVGGTISTLTFATSGSTVTAETIELTSHVHGQPDTGADATSQGNTLVPVA
jgi:hypothetical protein